MKKLILLILLLASPCLAAEPIQLARMNPYVAASAGGAAACTPGAPGSDGAQIGITTSGGTNRGYNTADALYCNLYQANCTGTIGTAYAYHYDTTIESIKMSVYSTTDTNPANAPTNGSLVGSTGAIASSSAEWADGATSGGSVTNGNYYWLCLHTPPTSGTWAAKDTTGLTRHIIPSAGSYATIPTTIPAAATCTGSGTPNACCTGEGTGCAATTTADRKIDMFVGIQ